MEQGISMKTIVILSVFFGLFALAHVASAQTTTAAAVDLGDLIITGSSDIANVFGTVQAAEAVLQATGLIGSDSQQMLDDLAALGNDISAVGGTLSWQISAQARETALQNMIGDVLEAEAAFKLNQPITQNSPEALSSLQTVLDAEADIAFQHLYDFFATTGAWNSDIPAAPSIPVAPAGCDDEEFVFDGFLADGAHGPMASIARRPQRFAGDTDGGWREPSRDARDP